MLRFRQHNKFTIFRRVSPPPPPDHGATGFFTWALAGWNKSIRWGEVQEADTQFFGL